MSQEAVAPKASLDLICPFNVAGDSHPGLVRELNEDSFGYSVDEPSRLVFAGVADGIGGHECGDIASNLCMKMLLGSWRAIRGRKDVTVDEAFEFLRAHFEKANEIIFNINETYNIQMGTTAVASVLLPDKLVVAHAGDSRMYRLRGERLDRLTNDHSFVAELVRKNVISEAEAQTHPFAHIISKSVGPVQNLEPEIHIFEREISDRYLLCSDGLTQHVSDDDIKKLLQAAFDPAQAVKRLLNAALRGGGEDNITLIAVFT